MRPPAGAGPASDAPDRQPCAYHLAVTVGDPAGEIGNSRRTPKVGSMVVRETMPPPAQ